MTEYNFTKSVVSLGRLQQEIQASEITVALNNINWIDSALSVFFKATLSSAEEIILNGIVAAHTGEPLPDEFVQKVQTIAGSEVATQNEKNDKTLRMAYAFGQADVNGVVRIAVKMPWNGRKMAYGDAEFEVRKFGDVVSKIEVSDLERLFAWQYALAYDSEATEPLSDEVMRTIETPYGYLPYYPVLDYYDDRGLELDPEYSPYNEGTVGGGCTMTFQFGNTYVEPVGGYGNIPGMVYLIIEAKNVITARTQGEWCQFSIDMGEPNNNI